MNKKFKRDSGFNKIEITTQKLPTSSQLKSNLLKNNCSQEVTSVKLKLFKRYQHMSNEFTLNKVFNESTGHFCLKSIVNGFNKLDRDKNAILDYQEWFQLSNHGSECVGHVFKACDLNNDSKLSLEEVCHCFDNVQNKCFFIRNEKNTNELKHYIQSLSQYLNGGYVKVGNYLPVCDEAGNFVPMQCDRLVNCWCVDSEGGVPRANTFRSIDQEPVNCLTILS